MVRRESNTTFIRENDAPDRFFIDLYSLCPETMKSRFNKNEQQNIPQHRTSSNIEYQNRRNKQIDIPDFPIDNYGLFLFGSGKQKQNNNEIQIAKIYNTNINTKTNK